MDIREAMRHAGMLDVSHALEERLMEALPAYLWYWREGRERRGLCSSCRNIVDIPRDGTMPVRDVYLEDWDRGFEGNTKVWGHGSRCDGMLRHKGCGICPHCGREVEFRALGRSRKRMLDKRLVMEYRPSVVEENALVCIGWLVVMPWHEMDDETLQITPDIVPVELCVLRWGKGGVRFTRRRDYEGYNTADGRRIVCSVWREWERKKQCVSGWRPGAYMGNGMDVVLDAWSLENAMEDTPWAEVVEEARDTEAASWHDRLTLLDRIGRYGCIEYLYKTGQDMLAMAAIDGRTEGLLNLRGKTPESVLRLTRDEWAEVKGKHLRLGNEALAVHRLAKSKHWRMNMETCVWASRNGGDRHSLTAFGESWPMVDIPKALKYCRKQETGLRDYRDYLDMMQRNGVNQEAMKALLWPKDFREAHDREVARYKATKNDRLEARIAEAAEKWQKSYCFEACGLVLEPFATAKEIILEGSRLHICIGGYVERYADGGTILCKLRRKEAPDKPWHAVEFSLKGQMMQCRGEHNHTWADEEELVRAFWAAWDAEHHTKTDPGLRVRERKQEDAA